MPTIAQNLALRYPGDNYHTVIRNSLQNICEIFMASGLADPTFEERLTSGSTAQFWSHVSEAAIYQRLLGKIFSPRSGIGSGPDFLLELGSKRLWIEVTCPEPTGLPTDWLRNQTLAVTSTPHEAILLRWTHAIKEKSEGLLGSLDGTKLGYIQKGIVLPEDIYVIAVNGCQMRHNTFPALHGISQLPYAVEAVLPIGPYQLQIDRQTLKTVSHGHQHRSEIKNHNGSPIPTHAFLDPRNQMVSAIWAVDFTGYGLQNCPEQSALIHNPNALNPLPRGFLAVDEEYEATQVANDKLLVQLI
jgi:hypothetical protein